MKDWKEEYNKILHEWYKGHAEIEIDKNWLDTVRGKKGGFWAIKCQELEDFIEKLLNQAKQQTAKAYGGCENCYGKGYSTLIDNRGKKIKYCSCERGEQLEKIIKEEK